MNKARAIDVALKEGGDYADASMRLTGLEAEQRRLLHELKKATA